LSSVCKVPANEALCQAFKELGSNYCQAGNYNASACYRRVFSAISKIPFEVPVENVHSLCKSPSKTAGIGKASADKIFEFLTTGSMSKLEEKRAAAEKDTTV
jgi:DNA polymerase/3'-5' exonuclease PolX